MRAAICWVADHFHRGNTNRARFVTSLRHRDTLSSVYLQEQLYLVFQELHRTHNSTCPYRKSEETTRA